MRLLLAVAAAALALPAAAEAHVTVKPPFVEAGVETEIAFETPNERAPNATVEISATAPPGVEIVSVQAPAGWTARVSGSTATWRGGTIEGESTASFPLRVLARVRAGTYEFTSAQRYSDGGVVRWKASFSVLPAGGDAAPSQNLRGAVAAGVAGLVVIAASLVALRIARRRSLQNR
jgi:uncharacterized protein YcnI